MYDIDSNIIERNMFYKNELILKYKIEYPKIISKSCMGNKFNEFNLKKRYICKIMQKIIYLKKQSNNMNTM